MTDRSVLFRVDGGNKVGLGHIMRCIALARRLKANGVRCRFISHTSDTVARIIAPEGFPLVSVDPSLDENATFEKVEECLSNYPVDALIVDLPEDLPDSVAEDYASLTMPLVLFDDHGPVVYYASLAINAIAHPDHLDGRHRETPHIHEGAEYIILDAAFRANNRSFERQQQKSVLIAMGGADPHNITTKAAKALADLPTDVNVHALLGPAFRHRNEVYALQNRLHRPIIISQSLPVDELPAFFASFDLAVMSFGISTYAAAHLGVPTVLLAHNDDGAAAAATFEQMYHCTRYLGRYDQVEEVRIRYAVEELVGDRSVMKKMGAFGRTSVDGEGLERVEKLVLSLLES